jgi:hypothetical protein
VWTVEGFGHGKGATGRDAPIHFGDTQAKPVASVKVSSGTSAVSAKKGIKKKSARGRVRQ